VTSDTMQKTGAYANPLCQKLRMEFQHRGANAPGLASSIPTGEVVKRVSRGLDPYERADETVVFRAATATMEQTAVLPRAARAPRQTAASTSHRTVKKAEKAQSRPENRTVSAREAYPGRNIKVLNYVDRGVRSKSQTFENIHNRGFVFSENIKVPGYTKAYRSAERVRNTAAQYYNSRAKQMKRSEGVFAIPFVGQALKVAVDAIRYAAQRVKRKVNTMLGISISSEERIASSRRNIPVGAIMLTVVFAILLMVIVYSFSQVNEMKSEISDLEAKQGALLEEQNELSLELEVRDDIRLIREIATGKLGMVSADSVESRYVSVSGGERIELATDEQESEKDFSSTLFSALAGRFTALKYYFN